MRPKSLRWWVGSLDNLQGRIGFLGPRFDMSQFGLGFPVHSLQSLKIVFHGLLLGKAIGEFRRLHLHLGDLLPEFLSRLQCGNIVLFGLAEQSAATIFKLLLYCRLGLGKFFRDLPHLWIHRHVGRCETAFYFFQSFTQFLNSFLQGGKARTVFRGHDGFATGDCRPNGIQFGFCLYLLIGCFVVSFIQTLQLHHRSVIRVCP